MFRWTDSDYLRSDQYADSSNLSARMRLHQLYSTNPTEMWHWAFDQLMTDARPSCRILELGCGTGEQWRKNADRIPQGWEITLSDFSPGMARDAQKNLKGIVSGFDFCAVDAQDIPYAENTFDLVLAHFMLYHVPDRTRAIAEIGRVLRLGGCLHAITLGQNHMRQLHEFTHVIAPGVVPSYDATIRPFSLESGAEQLAGNFAEVTMIRYDCDLEVTELQPLMDYVLSMMRADEFDVALTDSFRVTAQRVLEQDGSIHIAKEVGLFIARGVKRATP